MWKLLYEIEQTDFSTWIREGNFIGEPFSTFYVMLGFHSIGMAAVVGVCWMLALRVYGYYQYVSMPKASELMTIAWWGFIINLISGLLLFIAQPRRELIALYFDIKILMIILAVITMRVMQKSLESVAVVTNSDGSVTEIAPQRARVAAFLTMLFWLFAIIAGRLIGYSQPPPPGPV